MNLQLENIIKLKLSPQSGNKEQTEWLRYIRHYGEQIY
jgi:hypothetical protein